MSYIGLRGTSPFGSGVIQAPLYGWITPEPTGVLGLRGNQPLSHSALQPKGDQLEKQCMHLPILSVQYLPSLI